jgi:hypothetical protein
MECGAVTNYAYLSCAGKLFRSSHFPFPEVNITHRFPNFLFVHCFNTSKNSYKYFTHKMASEELSWQDKVSKKRAAQQDCIPEAWRLPASDIKSLSSDANVLALPEKSGLLSSEELGITSEYDVIALSEKLRSGTFTAVAVVTAFCKRAAIAHQAVCFVVLF